MNCVGRVCGVCFTAALGAVLCLSACGQTVINRYNVDILNAQLTHAVQNGDTRQVLFLLKSGANVNAAGKLGMTPLMWATLRERTDLLKLLIEHGADVNYCDPTTKWPYCGTALSNAVESGTMAAVKLLLDRGANVNLRQVDGSTALMYACEHLNVNMVRLLLDRGADVSAKCAAAGNALTLLFYPGLPHIPYPITADGKGIPDAKARRETLAKLLISKGVNVNVRDKYGRTAIFYARLFGDEQDAVTRLKKAGATD